MSNLTPGELAGLAEKYIDAYNSGYLDRIGAAIANDVELTHHNRGVHVKGREAAMHLFEGAGAAVPDKAFSHRRSLDVLGTDRVVVRHTWGGTAVADVPGIAVEGETVRLDLATFMTFRNDLLVEYHDYG